MSQVRTTIVPCSDCGTRNRVPDRASGVPKCGRCGTALPWITESGDDDFGAVVEAASVPVLVDLWAEWCRLCRMVSPALEQTGPGLAGRLKLVKVNVYVCRAVAPLRGAGHPHAPPPRGWHCHLTSHWSCSARRDPAVGRQRAPQSHSLTPATGGTVGPPIDPRPRVGSQRPLEPPSAGSVDPCSNASVLVDYGVDLAVTEVACGPRNGSHTLAVKRTPGVRSNRHGRRCHIVGPVRIGAARRASAHTLPQPGLRARKLTV